MITTIQPSGVKGTIWAPASKSSMQRACAAALLYGGEVIIRNPGHSNDDKAALGVIRDLGATIEALPDGSLLIRSKGISPATSAVNCGESGLGIRMFAPIISLSDRAIRVNGEGSLLTRPMDFFDEIFPLLGIEVKSNEGKLPLSLQGPLQPRNITIDGSLSSQFLTGLLFSYAAAGANGVAIKVNNLKSKPYIDLTLGVLAHFGWVVENRHYEEFYFNGSRALAGGSLEYTVEGDWSGGAFLLVAGAIAGPITVKGLDPRSTQADKAILKALEDSGAAISYGNGEMTIGPAAGGLKAFHFDATDCPDLFPPLVALAAYCSGVTVIDGVDRLAHKESNRGLTLRDEFGKLGLLVELDGDRMRVHGVGGGANGVEGDCAEDRGARHAGGGANGGANGGAGRSSGHGVGGGAGNAASGGLRGAVVHSRHDHRIAMACAVAALRAEGETVIEEAQAINKSYPDFYEHLQQLGAGVHNKTELV